MIVARPPPFPYPSWFEVRKGSRGSLSETWEGGELAPVGRLPMMPEGSGFARFDEVRFFSGS